MKYESKPKPNSQGLSMKTSKPAMYCIDSAAEGANRIGVSIGENFNCTKASIIRDMIEAAIISNANILTIEDRTFSIRELIEIENPDMNNITNIIDIVLDSKKDYIEIKENFKNFILKTTYEIFYEMKEDIKDELELNKEDIENYDSIINDFNFIIESYRSTREKREFEEIYLKDFTESVDEVICRIDDLEDFVSENDLLCDDFEKRFKDKIKSLPKYNQIKPLYFYDKFRYKNITTQLKYIVKLWYRYLHFYSVGRNEELTYSDFEKQIFNFIK